MFLSISLISVNLFGLSDEAKWIAENIIPLPLSLVAIVISIVAIFLTAKANKIANEALVLAKNESKVKIYPFLRIESILLVKSKKSDLERSHHRYIARMSDVNKKELDLEIFYDDLDATSCKEMIIKQDSIYLTKFKERKCMILNFLINPNHDEIINIIIEHQVNIIKLVNYGIPIAQIYANFAYIYYNDFEERGRQIYLKGDKSSSVDVNGEEIFEIALDEVTSKLIGSICTLDPEVYSNLPPETELIHSSIKEAKIKYRKLIISLNLIDITGIEHDVILILDTSTGKLNINGFIEVKKEAVVHAIIEIEKARPYKILNISEDIFQELLASHNRI